MEYLKPFENEGKNQETCTHLMGGYGNSERLVCSGCGKEWKV
jgi:hypothetical protein